MKKKFTILIAAAVMLLTMMASTGTMWGQTKITDYNNIVSGKTYYIGATIGGNDYYFQAAHTYASTGVQGTAVTDINTASAMTFNGSGTSWTIAFDNGMYLQLNSSNGGKVNIKAANTTEGITFTASNNNSLIRLTNSNTYLQRNSTAGTARFGSYGGTQKDVWLIEAETGPTQLSTPTNFAATPGNEEATFTWTAVEHASSYTISYTPNSGAEQTVASITGTSKTIEGLTNGTEYTCKIKAVGDGENYSDSEYSSTITVTPTDATFYNVNITSPLTGGSVTASAATATAGTTITLTATPSAGYTFNNIASNWTVTPLVTITSGANNTATFEMPANDVTVGATFTAMPVYTVSCTTPENGTLSVSPTSGYNGVQVTITATPNSGYELATLTATDDEGEITITDNKFNMLQQRLPLLLFTNGFLLQLATSLEVIFL